MRRCWTCQRYCRFGDDACPQNSTVRSMRAAGTPGNEIYDATTPDLFDEPDDWPRHEHHPVFTASRDSDDECCGDGIERGQQIRADGWGGYIHASAECEGMCRR